MSHALEERPVDCIYEGDRKLYLNPTECIDCGACEPACPVEAITTVRAAVGDQQTFAAEDARFFAEPLPGREAPLGNPGGTSKIGSVYGHTVRRQLGLRCLTRRRWTNSRRVAVFP